MFPSTSSRETLRLSGKQNSLFPSGAHIKCIILPILDYGCIVWLDCSKGMSEKLERLQNQEMRTILRVDRRACSQDMCKKLGLLTLYNRRRFLHFQLIFKIMNNVTCPESLVSYLPTHSSKHNRRFRDRTLLHLPKAKSAAGQSTFQFSAARDCCREQSSQRTQGN